MKKLSFFLLVLLTSSYTFGQNLQNANWCFGFNARVDFNPNPPTATNCSITNSNTGMDAASVSDGNGQLLFYTNGMTVWGKDNAPMQNGNVLYGGAGTGYSGQYLSIVPKPNNPNLYYIFHGSFKNAVPPEGHEGIYYSVVDMRLNNCNGDIVQGLKNIPLKNDSNTPIDYNYNTGMGLKVDNVKVTTAIETSNAGIWVVFFLRFDENTLPKRYVYSYLVSDIGINNVADGTSPGPTASTQVPNSNYPGPAYNDVNGDIKISPDGTKLCDAASAAIILYSFNSQTGFVTFPNQIYVGVPGISNSGYGMEFSPNSQFIYFNTVYQTIHQQKSGKEPTYTTYIRLYQRQPESDMNVLIDSFEVSDNSGGDDNIPIANVRSFGLQRAINNMVYMCVENPFAPYLHGFLGAIQNPNLPYPFCSFNHYEVTLSLGTYHFGHLPQWVYKTPSTPNPTTCTPWPKSYSGQNLYYKIFKTSSDNLATFIGGDMLTNVNHTGVLPPGPGSYGVQYNSQTGITNWVKNDLVPIFALNSGDIQMQHWYTLQTSFYNSTTGQQTNPPGSVPANEVILAETTNGGFNAFITSNGNSLNVHLTNGPPIPPKPFINGASFITNSYFNQSNKKLFVEYHSYQYIGRTLAVYKLELNNTLTLLNDPPPPFSPANKLLMSVNSNDKAYYISSVSQQILEYDYVTDTYSSQLNWPGFSNNGVGDNHNKKTNRYVEDNMLIVKLNENKMYFINTITGQNKSIPYSLQVAPFFPEFNYVYDNDFIYLVGNVEGQNAPGYITLGSQSIYYYNNNYLSTFITKFNISDFNKPAQQNVVAASNMFEKNNSSNSLSEESEQIEIFPNPATALVTITSGKNSITNIQLSDIYNNVVLTKSFSESKNFSFSVNNLMPGVYYCIIKTKNGVAVNKKVVVLRQ